MHAAAALASAALVLLATCTPIRRLEAACHEGDPGACDDLGARYAYGDGVERDEARAKELGERAWALCRPDGGGPTACALLFARHPVVPLALPPRPVSAGRGDASFDPVLSIVLFADGHAASNGAALPDDAAILALARRATPATRAVINADANVTHGRVIHVLDLLKQAGLARVSFGVTVSDAKAP